MSLMQGLRIVELDGYLPSRHIGKMLKDLGAEVILIKGKEIASIDFLNTVNDGKHKLILDFKNKTDIEMLISIIKNSDIFIDSYRPGTLEKIGLNPEKLLGINPKLIILRVTSYGQEGELKLIPGVEINCMSLSGMFDSFKKNNDSKPLFRTGLIGDIFAGSTLSFYYLTQALVQRSLTGKGGIIDSSINDNLFLLNSFSQNRYDNEFEYISLTTKDLRFLVLKIRNDAKIHENLFNLLQKLGNKEILPTIYSILEFEEKFRELTREHKEEYFIRLIEGMSGISIIPIVSYKDMLEEFPKNGFLKFETSFDIKAIDPHQVDQKTTKIINKKEFLTSLGISKDHIDYYLKKEEPIIKPKF